MAEDASVNVPRYFSQGDRSRNQQGIRKREPLGNSFESENELSSYSRRHERLISPTIVLETFSSILKNAAKPSRTWSETKYSLTEKFASLTICILALEAALAVVVFSLLPSLSVPVSVSILITKLEHISNTSSGSARRFLLLNWCHCRHQRQRPL